jgi:hypothetical protein
MTIHAQIIQAAVLAVPQVFGYLSADALEAIKAAGYDGIRTVMRGEIFGAVFGYLSGSGYVTTFKAQMTTAISKAYIEAADAAYVDGGGSLPLDDETAAWARGQIDLQFGYIDELFERLKDIRKQGDFDAGAIAQARAEGYASSLDSFFGEAKMRGSDNITLEFGGSDGKENCSTCKRLKGKRHKISYILKNDLIPHPGNTNFECLCYRCEHFWFNPKTGERYDG